MGGLLLQGLVPKKLKGSCERCSAGARCHGRWHGLGPGSGSQEVEKIVRKMLGGLWP
jgi:hypothetical protein